MSVVPVTPSDHLLLSMTCYQCSGSQYICSTQVQIINCSIQAQEVPAFFRQWERRGGGGELGWIEEETVIIKYINLKTFSVLLSFVEKKNPMLWL